VVAGAVDGGAVGGAVVDGVVVGVVVGVGAGGGGGVGAGGGGGGVAACVVVVAGVELVVDGVELAGLTLSVWAQPATASAASNHHTRCVSRALSCVMPTS